jgi:hypothetical protein
MLRGHVVEDPTTEGAGALLAGGDLDVDAFVAVFWLARAPQRQRSALFVEIGIAIGRGVPVLLVTKPNLKVASLAGLPRIVATDDPDPIFDVQIELFLEGVYKKIDQPTFKRSSDGSPHAPLARTQGLDFEKSVDALLSSSAVEFMKSTGARDDRADFTLYFSGDDGDLGVVLVEAKNWSRPPSGALLRDTLLRLSDQVLRSGAGLGLLVVSEHIEKIPATPLVAVASIDELRLQLAERSLPGMLRRARNESIHGR